MNELFLNFEIRSTTDKLVVYNIPKIPKEYALISWDFKRPGLWMTIEAIYSYNKLHSNLLQNTNIKKMIKILLKIKFVATC